MDGQRLSPHLAGTRLVAQQPPATLLGRRTVVGKAAVQATHLCIFMQRLPRAAGRKQALLKNKNLASSSLYFPLPCCWVTLFAQCGRTLFSAELKTKAFLLQTYEMINQNLCLLFWFRFSI